MEYKAKNVLGHDCCIEIIEIILIMKPWLEIKKPC